MIPEIEERTGAKFEYVPVLLGVLKLTVLREAGFDAERFAELVQDADVKARLLDNTTRSVERGTFGSPTFFVGDEIFFGKDRLRDVEEAILSAR